MISAVRGRVGLHKAAGRRRQPRPPPAWSTGRRGGAGAAAADCSCRPASRCMPACRCLPPPLPKPPALLLALTLALPELSPGCRARAGREGGPQHGGQLGGVGVLQIDHADAAGGCCRPARAGPAWRSCRGCTARRAGVRRRARSVRCCADRPCTVTAARHRRLRARRAPPRCRQSARRCTSGARSEAEPHASCGTSSMSVLPAGVSMRRNDAGQALQVLGVVGDHQACCCPGWR